MSKVMDPHTVLLMKCFVTKLKYSYKSKQSQNNQTVLQHHVRYHNHHCQRNADKAPIRKTPILDVGRDI